MTVDGALSTCDTVSRIQTHRWHDPRRIDPRTVDHALGRWLLPRCSVSDQPRQARRTGLSEVGLPYAADAGITRHLAHFLTRQAAGGDPGDFVKPTAVLFNGGVLKADILRDRVTAVINDWLTQAAGQASRFWTLEVLCIRRSRCGLFWARESRWWHSDSRRYCTLVLRWNRASDACHSRI